MASELEGVADVLRQLGELAALDDGKAIRAAVSAAGKLVVVRAQANIPQGSVMHKTYKGRIVAPGFASRNVTQQVIVSKDKQMAAALIGVRGEAFYAALFVERGTSKMAAQPWLVPAFEATQSEQQKGIAASLVKTLKRIAKRAARGRK